MAITTLIARITNSEKEQSQRDTTWKISKTWTEYGNNINNKISYANEP